MGIVYSSNFERPERIRDAYARLELDTEELRGKASYDGQRGGFPLLYDCEEEWLVVDGNDNHTLVFGASGSKKTRTMVLPSIHVLAKAEESMIIHDAKGELYNRTAQMLKERGYRVVCINLRNPSIGNSWNPLSICYDYYKQGDIDRAAEFANDVACTLMQEEHSNDPFWRNSASDCMYGLILLLMRYCREYNKSDSAVNMANLTALRRELFKQKRGPFSGPESTWLWKWGSQDELIAAALSGTVTTAAETMQGILSTLDNKLRTFTIQPALLDMLSNNSIDIESIGKEKTAVFLITADEKASAYRSLVALFVSQSYQQLIYAAGKSGGRVVRRVNYILDEFSSLPAIGQDSFPSMITAARSRNIRFLIVAQSKHQLKSKYGPEADTIMANCTNWVIMFTRELELLREVSELCGEKDGKPNISVFDLQHFSKEKNEVLLMAGRMKPAVVQLLDIGRLDHMDRKDGIKRINIETPKRMPRERLDFSVDPNAPLENKAEEHEMWPGVSLFRESEQDKQKSGDRDLFDKPFSVDDLVKKIDQKISELEEEERREKKKLVDDNSEKSELSMEEQIRRGSDETRFL